MSYILDALRKAQTQRERAGAPGPDLGPMALSPRRNTGVPPIAWWGVAVLLAVLLAAGAWRWSAERSSGTTPAPDPAPPAAAAPAAASAALPHPAPMHPAPMHPAPMHPAPMHPAPMHPAPMPHAPTPAPSRPSPPEPAASAPQVAASALRAGSLPNLHGMPQEFQQSLPKLLVQGSVAGDNPSQRMVFIGGQVWHEGGEPAPGLVIEQIRARELVLRWRGERFLYAF